MNIKRHIRNSIRILCLYLVAGATAVAQVPLVYTVENTGAGCTPPPLPAVAQLTSYAMLPDPFAWSNGSGRIASFADWSCRRNEIKQEIERYEIGVKPPKPANITATYTGGVLTVRVTENGQTLTLTSNVTMPTGTGPFPVVIGMNARTGSLPTNLFNGVIQIPFNHDQVARYTQGTRDASYPFFRLYPNLTSNGYYSAWAWGVSRLIDGIEIVQAQMNADTKRIAVTGCSYAGKMALFAGAFDERIALTIAQESGGGGVNAWRVSETIGNVEKIGNTNYSWFMQSLQTNFQNGNAVKLPYDHHELMAMVAPRALLVLGNPPFEWLGDESGYVSSRAAQEIWTTLGVPDRFGFSFRGGHDHCSLPSASNSEVTAFVDKFLRNSTTANTNIAVHSFPNTDYNKWITAWKGLVLTPPNTNAPVVTITAPLTNASYTEGDNITINATATVTTGSISKVDFYQGTTLLGSDATAPYTFTWNNVTGGKYQITAKATSASNDAGTSAVITVLVNKAVLQTGTAPTIDGTVDALWNSVTAVPVTNVLSGTIGSAADLSANWKALWDATNLYVLVQVTDDVKRNDAGTDVYNDDGVEIYLDFGNNKPTAYGANDHQYTFRWNDATAAYEINGHSVAGIAKGSTNTTGGYIMEVRIPWATIGGTATANSLHGFDVMINDDDNGAARDKKIAWTATADDTWNNPSLMGTIVLKGLNCTPPAATITAGGATTVCSGTDVPLNANTGAGFTYIWRKDNTDIAGATAASYAAATSGSYTVTVTSGGCSATSTAISVTVNTQPAAPVVTAVSGYCQNAAAAPLTAVGTALKWYTVAQNGTPASSVTPSTAVTGTINYYVSQTVNGCESSRGMIAVTTNALPAATVTAGSATTFCAGGSVTLSANSGASYIWKNGSTQVGTGATYAATAAGSYTVEVTGSNTCKATSAAVVVTVNALPAAPAVTPTTVYCQNASATPLTATGAALKWYTVAQNGTPSTSVTPSTAVTGTTNYYVSQTVNGCESPRAMIAVTVNALPAAAITAGSAITFCAGGSVALTTGNAASYVWKNGATQVGTNATYSATVSGSYTVELTNTANCKAVSVPIVVTVTELPAAPTVIQPAAYCQHEPAVALTATGSALKWYTDAAAGASVLSVIPSTATAGVTTYYVSQTVNGCESMRAAVPVAVNAVPEATVTLVGSAAIIEGGSVLLKANTGTGLTYKWFKGTVQVGTAISYTATAAGEYSVEVTTAAGCKAVSDVTTVTVTTNQLSVITITSPLPDATLNGSITVSADISDPDGDITLVEFLAGTTVIGSTTSAPYEFIWETPGSGEHIITVRVTDANGGITTSAPVTVTSEEITTGLKSVNTIEAVVYPNPAAGNVFVETAADLSGAAFSVIDILGKEVPVPATATAIGANVDLSTLNEGSYVLLIRDGNSMLRKKVTVIK